MPRRESRQAVTIPLSHRLPNPPAVFLGRDEEIASFAAAIEQGPVTVVWGAGGMGKSSLVSAALSRRAPERVDRAICVGLADGLGESLTVQVGRVLLPMARARGDDSFATVLDVAEELDVWVVLDDLHKASETQARELLTLAARYARHTKWIATSRRRFEIDELAGQEVCVGPLGEGAMMELAERIEPSLVAGDRAAAVKRAAGSPWRLKQLVLRGNASKPAPRDVLSGLGEAERGCALCLWILEQPVTSVVVEDLGEAAQALPELEARALAVRRGERWQLHDVARAELDEAVGEADRAALRRHVLERWREGEPIEPLAKISLARLLLEEGERPAAAALLARRAGELLRGGFAPELWALLRDEGAPELSSARLQCALEVGAAAFPAIRPVSDAAPAHDRLCWAKIASSRGDADEAARVARAVAETADEPELRDEARLVAARALIDRGKLDEAATVLARARPERPALACTHDALLANIAITRDRREAHAIADRVLPAIFRLDPSERRAPGRMFARLLFELGRLHDLDALLDDDDDDGRDLGRQWLYIRACLAVWRGRLNEADALFERLRPVIPEGSILETSTRVFLGYVRYARGDLDGILDEFSAIERTSRDPMTLLGARHIARRCALALAEPPPPSDPPHPPGASIYMMELLDTAIAEQKLRAGAHISLAAPKVDVPEVAVAHARCEAISRLLAGEPGAAADAFEPRIEPVSRMGHSIVEAEARLLLCDLRAIAGEGDELAQSAAKLRALGERMGSLRYLGEARFYEALLCEPGAGAVLAIMSEARAPAAQRRVRELLVDDQRGLDRVDLELVRAWRPAFPWRARRGLSDTPWLIDTRELVVTSAAGRLDLSQTPLLGRLLACLCEHGGEASVETLVADVWKIDDYHPLRHDNRVRAAVRKLRRALDTLDLGAFVETREGGYALGGSPIHTDRK